MRFAIRSHLVLAFILGGCASVPTVRSAEVMPGPSLHVQGFVSTPSGETATTLWSPYYGCSKCDEFGVGLDAGLTYGWRPEPGPAGVAMTIGTSRYFPYVDGYL